MALFISIALIIIGSGIAWFASLTHAANKPKPSPTWLPYASGVAGGGFIAVLVLGLGTWWSWFLAFLALGILYTIAKDELELHHLKPSDSPAAINLPVTQAKPTSSRPPSSVSVSSISVNGGLEDLRAMCRDMVSDGVMDEEEVRQLAAYLDDHFWLTTDGLVKLMADYIRDVLADGEVTTMEGMDVLDLAAAVADGQTLADMKYWEPMAPLLDDEPPKVKRRSKAKSSKRKEGRKLDTISFTYRDAQGDVSQRRVVVHVLDEEYFNGFCLDRMANRTFRLDRVVGNITSEETGEISSCWEWAAGIDTEQELAKLVSDVTTAQSNMSILFTGFKRADRDRLETLAIAHGWQVKTAVSKQLFVLCTGPIDAPSKVAKAEELGVLVLTESAWLGTQEESMS